jgi:C-terminal processing protease CtpA/Prc
MDPESRKMRVVRDNGWLQKGDMILAIDSQKIYSVDEIVRACKGTPGSFLLLRFKRRGEEMVLILQRPAPPEPAVCRPKPVSPGYSLGVKCREHYAPYASQAQVIISKVANGGPAVGHLQPGDSLMSISGHALQSAQMLKYLVQGPVGSYVQIIYARGAEHSVHQLVFERSILSDGTGQLILIDMDTEVDELHPAVEERFAKEAEAAARGICSRFAEEERVAKEAEAKARAAAEAEAARLAAEAEKACVAEEERVAKEAEAKARAAAEAEAARLAAEAEKARVAEEERVAKEAEAKARAAAEAEEKKTIFSLGVHLMAPRGGLIMVGDVKDKNSCCWGHVKPGDVLLEVGGNAVQTIHDVKAGCQGALGSVCHVLYRSGASNRIYRLDLQRTKDPETNNSVFVALSSSHTRVKQQDDAASEVSEVSVKVGSLRLDEILHDDEPQIEEIEEQIAKRKADLEKLELLLEKARLKTPCLSPVTHQVAGEGKTKTCSFSLGVSLTQPSPGTILVAAVKNESSCCWGRLQAGDQLLAVDGITVTTPKDVKEGCRGALGSICEVHYKSGQFGSAHRLDLQRTTDNENNPVFVALSSANPSFLPFKPMSANQPRPTTSLAASIMALGASSSASHQAGKRDNRSASPSPSDSKFFSPSSLRKGVNGHGGRAGSSQHSGYRSGDSIRSPSMSPTFAPSHMGTFYGMPGL